MANLKFRSRDIPCTVMQWLVGGVDCINQRTHFFGLHGISQIRGGTGSRLIEIPICLHSPRPEDPEDDLAPIWNTRTELDNFISGSLNNTDLNQNGTLIYSNESPEWSFEYRDCTFEGATRIMWGDLPDYAGTIGGGWISFLLLRYTQLRF